ncbi:hypothetical protein F2Q68_00037739 [Brassica cretica]|nr:hypothetical protein F2Q68_00037739 [Brassica cretica]
MAITGDALRQAFMPKHEYESLREEEDIALIKLQRQRPFCGDVKLHPLNMYGNSDLFPGAFYLTDQETVDFYWMVVRLSSR